MNVFVLGTGRCGSKAFARACAHVLNYSSAHESRCGLLGDARFEYADNHIESDNRLSWLLGRLERKFGDRAFYVHLTRNDLDTARSFVRRYDRTRGIVFAYRQSILLRSPDDGDPMQVCLDYCTSVNANIAAFLQDKTFKMTFSVEDAKADFRRFWERIGATGDFDAAVGEWDRRHNASRGPVNAAARAGAFGQAFGKIGRIAQSLPAYIKYA